MISTRHAGRLVPPDRVLDVPSRLITASVTESHAKAVSMATEASSRLVLPAQLDQLTTLAPWVQALAQQLGLPPDLIHRIDLCLSELVANAISYGYPHGDAGTLCIRCWMQEGCTMIRIEDDGVEFDPTSHALPELPGSLDEASDTGRGIRLVRHFSDAASYQRTPAGNQLTLTFRDRPLRRQ
jgi:anti-sigma regulatory factor (Ser/Thr protein kinase)